MSNKCSAAESLPQMYWQPGGAVVIVESNHVALPKI